MYSNENSPPFKPEANYELQEVLLLNLQQEISARLFESGAAPRILAAEIAQFGSKIEVQGVDQLEKLFVPVIARRKVDGRDEKILRLAIVESKNAQTRTYAYRNLGEIDEQGFMHVFRNVPEDDAWQVYGEADMLQKLKGSEGTIPQLPNLSSSLLTIDNMNTAIRKASDNPRPNPYAS